LRDTRASSTRAAVSANATRARDGVVDAPSTSTPTVQTRGRRDALLACGAAAAMSFSSAAPARAAGVDPASLLTRRGMAKFTQGDVDGSIADFDAVIAAAPGRAPYMWQRGLSLYYAERLREGSAQFRRDVAVNPNDTEEAVWAFLCEARDKDIGFEKAREDLLVVGRDPRAYMRAAYALFAGTGDEDSLRAVAANGGAAEDFYTWLYLGLYREAKGDENGAKTAVLAAVATPYGSRSGDYMAALAEVHAKRRGWSV
jgi:hypothetical protein